MNERFTEVGLYTAAVVAVLDQASKWWLLTFALGPYKILPVSSFLNLVLSWNRGVTFGLLNFPQQWLPYIFIGIAVIIVAFLFNWLMASTRLTSAIGLGMIIGGAVGNAIDRARYGAVTDFLDFHLGVHHWYAFNLADSAIVCGVGLLLIENLATNKKRR